MTMKKAARKKMMMMTKPTTATRSERALLFGRPCYRALRSAERVIKGVNFYIYKVLVRG
jgi:hypothetical protein